MASAYHNANAVTKPLQNNRQKSEALMDNTTVFLRMSHFLSPKKQSPPADQSKENLDEKSLSVTRKNSRQDHPVTAAFAQVSKNY